MQDKPDFFPLHKMLLRFTAEPAEIHRLKEKPQELKLLRKLPSLTLFQQFF
jgi:hypothetical protein